MKILGLGGSGHDFSACICVDGKIENFIADERITRIKHSFIIGNQTKIKDMMSVKYLMDMLETKIEDMDIIVKNNILSPYFYSDIQRKTILSINHHLAHAASAFYTSEYNEADILVVDGGGDQDEEGMIESISFWHGKGSQIEKIDSFAGRLVSREVFFDFSMPSHNSIGGFYHAATIMLGFGTFDEGTVMALASYGNSKKYYKILKEYILYGKQGQFLFDDIGYLALKKSIERAQGFQEKADIAAAVQKITEEALIVATQSIKKLSGSENLCIAGGVALNSVANYKIYSSGIYNNIFIPPMVADDGTSIGAALYAWNYLEK